jgi:omega-6 fatty acid desaturase (delta-12 desaturase)
MVRTNQLCFALRGLLLCNCCHWNCCRPGYLILNSSGPAKYRKAAHKSHFHPYSALFTDRQRLTIALSDVGFFAMVGVIAYACTVFGAANVFFYYFVPYLGVNLCLVLITYLQHTDVFVPHYREKEFTWLRGALATVDRSYGTLVNAMFHHITDTHVVHHLFHDMPFYNAEEATVHVKKLLGPYYLYDPTPIPAALWRSWNQCKFVEDEGDIIFMKTPADMNGQKKHE